jgi:hypothetical protein
VGGESIQIVHYFDHGFLEEEKSMIYSFTVTFGAKYLIGMVTSVPPSKLSILLKVIFFISLKTTKILVTMPIKYFAPKVTVKLYIIDFSSSRKPWSK